MQKILYIKGSGLGDIISSIPKLKEFKKNPENKVYWLYMRSFDYNKSNFMILKILKNKGFIDKILIINFNLFDFIKFTLKYFRFFNLVFIGGIATKKNILLSRMVGQKIKYNVGFNEKMDIVSGELGYKGGILCKYNIFEIGKFKDISNYVVIYPSWINRSLHHQEWINIGKYLINKGYNIVIIGGNREKWFLDIYNSNNIKYLSLIGNLELQQIIDILGNSCFNICCNGGIMWLANLINKKNINIHIISRFIWEPIVDSINSFNLRLYHYKDCNPCEGNCMFKGTNREFECKNFYKANYIIDILEKYYN